MIIAIRSRMSPVRNMRAMEIQPLEKTMALGGVATGNMKANEAITAEEGARLTAHLKMAAASLRLGRLFSWSRPGLSSLD